MPESVVTTRTEAICRAMLEELRRRRAFLDGTADLASITMTVKLDIGNDTDPVRAVYWEDQRVMTRRRGSR